MQMKFSEAIPFIAFVVIVALVIVLIKLGIGWVMLPFALGIGIISAIAAVIVNSRTGKEITKFWGRDIRKDKFIPIKCPNCGSSNVSVAGTKTVKYWVQESQHEQKLVKSNYKLYKCNVCGHELN